MGSSVERTFGNGAFLWESNPDVVSEDRIQALYRELKQLTNVDAAVKKANIENIEKTIRLMKKI